ncbi:hypothetical protein [Sulfurimonas sp.]|nr:hypothetical protein [Sulfurimonas sp.]
MKKVITAMLLILGLTATLSATQTASDDKAIIMGEEVHPDKGILY